MDIWRIEMKFASCSHVLFSDKLLTSKRLVNLLNEVFGSNHNWPDTVARRQFSQHCLHYNHKCSDRRQVASAILHRKRICSDVHLEERATVEATAAASAQTFLRKVKILQPTAVLLSNLMTFCYLLALCTKEFRLQRQQSAERGVAQD